MSLAAGLPVSDAPGPADALVAAAPLTPGACAFWAVWCRSGALRSVVYYGRPRTYREVVDDLDPGGALAVGTDRGDRLERVSETRARELSARHGVELVAHPEQQLARGSLVRFGLILSADQVGILPGPPRREDEPAEPPSYSNTSTGRVLADIDERMEENLRARNQLLRGRLRDAAAGLAAERSQRRHAEARLAAVTAERDAALARIAVMDKTLRLVATTFARADEAEMADSATAAEVSS